MIAEYAARSGQGTVPVGAGETGINRDLMYPAPEKGSEIGVQIIIAFVLRHLLDLVLKAIYF